MCQRLSLVGILITVITKRCRSQELAKELSAREREERKREDDSVREATKREDSAR